jgi:pimeloyl-ACP methyl ester carboxylesterase
MSESRREWLCTYHEGDSRLRDKRHGILQLNREKKRIEFAVQTNETAPMIIVSYPLSHLNEIKIIEKRQKMKKQKFIQFSMGDPPNEMSPTFSFNLDEIDNVKDEIQKFKEEIKSQEDVVESDKEADVINVFANLLMTPIEQFQSLLGEFASRLRILTLPTRKATQTVISSLEPKFPYKTQEIDFNGQRFRFFSTTHPHSTILVLLSPIGGRIEDYYPLIPSLLGKYQIYILGSRGYAGLLEGEFHLKEYVQDLKSFLKYIGDDKSIILGAHSLFSAIILEEFLSDKHTNIQKIILISGLHKAPNTFRKGVKSLPPTQLWPPIKGQVRKIAPKILFSKRTESSIIDPFIQFAFTIPDRVYYEIFKDFLPKYDYTKNIQQLAKPLLVIWGKDDKIISPKLKKEMIEVVPNPLLTYKELPGGHMVILEEPEKVGREINKFINSTKWSQIKID